MTRRQLIGRGATAAIGAAAILSCAPRGSPAIPPQETGSTANGLGIVGSSDANDIFATFGDGTYYTITDTAGITAGAGCRQIDPNTASCSDVGTLPAIVVEGDRGDDRITFSATLLGNGVDAFGDTGRDVLKIEEGGSAHARFNGGGGIDELTGAASHDFLAGNRGPDRLVSRSGGDRLAGAQGKDTFIAGPGNDRVVAAFGDADQAIRCGSGEDVALIDRDQDPQPVGCERVVYE